MSTQTNKFHVLEDGKIRFRTDNYDRAYEFHELLCKKAWISGEIKQYLLVGADQIIKKVNT